MVSEFWVHVDEQGREAVIYFEADARDMVLANGHVLRVLLERAGFKRKPAKLRLVTFDESAQEVRANTERTDDERIRLEKLKDDRP